MGWIGPRRNRREVAGPAAGPMGPMSGRTPNRQLAAFQFFLDRFGQGAQKPQERQ
jgi:hypothetical protein